MKMKDLCADERPREKLLDKGAYCLSNAELIAILLRTGTGGKNVIDIARETLMLAGNKLGELTALPPENQCKVSGIGPGKAVTLAAAFELGRRVAEEAGMESASRMDTPEKVFRTMLPHMKNLDHEECWTLFLSRSNRLISKEKMSSGGQDSTVIDKKAIVRRALEKKSAAVILVHNHPSGSALPSTEDIRQTRDLHRALDTCDIRLIDHVIISGGSYYSFSDECLIGRNG